jgi:hypothetical protein
MEIRTYFSSKATLRRLVGLVTPAARNGVDTAGAEPKASLDFMPAR